MLEEIPHHTEGEPSIVRETSEQVADEVDVEASERSSDVIKGKQKVGKPSSIVAPASEPSPAIVGDEAQMVAEMSKACQASHA
ncbi:hypothetical protein LWI29_021227 [Acer saccharum]|uniref:Uncharacterized protein n=1 Tax=Acer saccharum TaxID=4024 RepID=A0AA39RZ46_ACESA|nr:hypothetical protein LWI29_021227 [Acer saccharum]